MMARMIMLIRRELWEHRALYLAPSVVAVLLILAVVLAYVSAALFNGIGLDNIVYGMTLGVNEAAAGFGILAISPVLALIVVLYFVVFFYTLDALYAERKDRSVLFWRSLPITDAETVVSKLLTAVLVAPLIVFLIALFTQIIILLISTVMVWMGGGDASDLIWGGLPVGDILSFTFMRCIGFGLWSVPFAAWFLFCSAFVKKTPFLWAVLPFALVPLLEQLAFRTSFFASIVWGHIRDLWIYMFDFNPGKFMEDEFDVDPENIPEIIRMIAPDNLFLSPGVWGGVVVGAGLTAAAIYVRRYRTEAES